MATKLDAAAEILSRTEARAVFEAACTPALSGVRAKLMHLADSAPQVFLFEGGSSRERSALAYWWAALQMCRTDTPPCLECPACLQTGAGIQHDVQVFDGRQGSIKIADVRDLRTSLGEAPQHGKKRVILFLEAQALGIEAANALLKSFEEPYPHLSFVLCAPQRERLLPTLISRSWVLTLPWPVRRLDAEQELWNKSLSAFLRDGRGWFELTSAKGAVDAECARRVLAGFEKAQSAALARQNDDALSADFARLDNAVHTALDDLFEQCHESLQLPQTVNPALCLDWLASQIFLLIRRQGSYATLPLA